ncbi:MULTISPECIES: hypothetical protein [Streptosporangiaceae]|uniref:hypothetical protein n=1 Tax=Streptosporangiaceae TaxID=2004 RepID=UPI0033F2D82F
MRAHRIAGVVSAVALAGGLLTAALPAAAAAQSETVTITGSKLLPAGVSGYVFLKCPDSHPYMVPGQWGTMGPFSRVLSPPAGYPGYMQQATFFFGNGNREDVHVSAWMNCTTVKPF